VDSNVSNTSREPNPEDRRLDLTRFTRKVEEAKCGNSYEVRVCETLLCSVQVLKERKRIFLQKRISRKIIAQQTKDLGQRLVVDERWKRRKKLVCKPADAARLNGRNLVAVLNKRYGVFDSEITGK
jgi:hypothetical protein